MNIKINELAGRKLADGRISITGYVDTAGMSKSDIKAALHRILDLSMDGACIVPVDNEPTENEGVIEMVDSHKVMSKIIDILTAEGLVPDKYDLADAGIEMANLKEDNERMKEKLDRMPELPLDSEGGDNEID